MELLLTIWDEGRKGGSFRELLKKKSQESSFLIKRKAPVDLAPSSVSLGITYLPTEVVGQKASLSSLSTFAHSSQYSKRKEKPVHHGISKNSKYS